MTPEESAFQAALDLNPDDFTCRLVFADYLEEQGDERADGMRALGVLQKRSGPGHVNNKLKTDAARFWEKGRSYWDEPHRALPEDWYLAMGRGAASNTEFPTRCEAEDAAALAFAKLPPTRRRELLAQPALS